jgi:class 3 adenylate cyclase
MARAALLYENHSGQPCAWALAPERTLTIGRGGEVDLALSWDRSVSLLHAQLVRVGEHWLIADDGLSRNGTFVNGERLAGRRRLREGDVVRLGATTLTFRDERVRARDDTTVSDAPGSSPTLTLMFCDLVGSTELLDRLGDAAGERALREHFAMLRGAAAEHGGREVKSLGDGLMLAFASALSAVACAVSMQQRIAAHAAGAPERAMGLRVGVNAGEAISAGDDYFGSPVVVAARLCDRAGAGQILASEVVRSLAGNRAPVAFAPLGALALKGLRDPVSAFELDWKAHRSRKGSSA